MRDYLTSLMQAYTIDNLVGISEAKFRVRLESSVWGHNHDFGTFSKEGKFGDRHVNVLANFLTHFTLTLDDIRDKDVFDIGCSTGGTSLLLAALGNRVTAIEKSREHANVARYLVKAFGLENVKVEAKPLSNCSKYRERFDVVYFIGVVYHLLSPIAGLQIIFNSLRPSGLVLIESAHFQSDEPLCLYTGHGFCPSQAALKLMMEDAGFEAVEMKFIEPRQYAIGRKASNGTDNRN